MEAGKRRATGGGLKEQEGANEELESQQMQNCRGGRMSAVFVVCIGHSTALNDQ